MFKRIGIATLLMSIFLTILSFQSSKANIFGPSECQKHKSDITFQDNVGKTIYQKLSKIWADKLKNPGTSRNYEIVTYTVDLSQNYVSLTGKALAHQKCYSPNQIANITSANTVFKQLLVRSKTWLSGDQNHWSGFWTGPTITYPWTLSDLMK